MKYINTFSAGVLVVFCFVSCQSTTTIRAVDSKGKIRKDVDIYIKDRSFSDKKTHIGKGEAIYKGYGGLVEFKRPGCLTQAPGKLNQVPHWFSTVFAGLFGGFIGSYYMSNHPGVPDYETVPAIFVYSVVGGIFLRFILPGTQMRNIQEHHFQCVKASD